RGLVLSTWTTSRNWEAINPPLGRKYEANVPSAPGKNACASTSIGISAGQRRLVSRGRSQRKTSTTTRSITIDVRERLASDPSTKNIAAIVHRSCFDVTAT